MPAPANGQSARRALELVDSHGVPMRQLADEPGQEIVGSSLASIRSPFSSYPAEGITPGRVSGVFHPAARDDGQACQELAEHIEERDTHYAGVLATRKRGVEQLPLNVVTRSLSSETA